MQGNNDLLTKISVAVVVVGVNTFFINALDFSLILGIRRSSDSLCVGSKILRVSFK